MQGRPRRVHTALSEPGFEPCWVFVLLNGQSPTEAGFELV
jgi:hypothetical protein